MRTLATISSAEGTLAIPPESEKTTVSVWLIKIHRMLQKLYTGEEETPREMHLEALNVFSATEYSMQKHRTKQFQSWEGPWR